MARDHGGDLDAAIARFGGARGDWIDLSTGINRLPYPLPPLPDRAFRDLPGAADGLACARRPAPPTGLRPRSTACRSPGRRRRSG